MDDKVVEKNMKSYNNKSSKLNFLPPDILKEVDKAVANKLSTRQIGIILDDALKGKDNLLMLNINTPFQIKKYRAQKAEYGNVEALAANVDNEINGMQSLALKSSAIDPTTGRVICTEHNTTEMIIELISQYQKKLAWIDKKPAYEISIGWASVYEKYLAGMGKLTELLKKLTGEIGQGDNDLIERQNEFMYGVHKLYMDTIKEIFGMDRFELFVAKLKNNHLIMHSPVDLKMEPSEYPCLQCKYQDFKMPGQGVNHDKVR